MKAIIIGGGIGGLSMALSLHQAGIEAKVFESVKEIGAVGAGINLQPNAVRELDEMGLGKALFATGVATQKWSCYNKHGQLIWSEPRGVAAGYKWPQISVHRGHLLMLLFNATRERLGAGNVVTGHHLASFEQDAHGVAAHFIDRATGRQLHTERGDLLIGADGIHSAVRTHFYPNEGPTRYCGEMQWRASVEMDAFLDGRTQIIVGHRMQRLVAYSMSNEALGRGRVLVNWICEIGMPETSRPDWDRKVSKDVFAHAFANWRFPWLDVPALIDATPEIFEFPKCDRDPVDRWTFGRVTLLGDAAHPMLPTGSQAGSQAVVDARVLAQALATEPSVEAALKSYETQRLKPMSEITLKNRELGPERAMQIVEDRAPGGFKQVEDVISREEMAAITENYKRSAGFDSASVNTRPSYLQNR
jgi:2-polyprenyl-6-methoxyphenol hydroxylase-like FAD-dependent oxidoreductase